MKPSGSFNLSPSTLRLLFFGWLALGGIAAICVFVVILALAGSGPGGQTASKPTPRPVRTSLPAQNLTTPTALISGSGTAQPSANATTSAPARSLSDDGKFALGGQIPAYQAMPHEDLMRSAGMSWVKFQITWQPGALARDARDLILFGHQKGFKVLVSVKGPLHPASIDFNDYNRFVKSLVSDKPDAVEIWNEMNLDREWPTGQLDPNSYVTNMLKPSYETIKAKNPDTMVIIGALAPTGADDGRTVWEDQRYVKGMAAAGAAKYADCIGVHHNAGTTPPSAKTGHVSDDGRHHYSWYFLPTLDVYRTGFNGALPLCLTEFGYLSPDGYGPLPTTFAWGAKTTVADQAAWLAEGVKLAKQLGYVRLMVIWNVDFPADDYATDPKAGFAIVRPDGSCPACDALWNAMTGQ